MSETNRYVIGMSADEYHAHPAVSRSQLSELARSPAHFRAAYIERTRIKKTTPAMVLGTAIHAKILEHESFASRYYSGEKINRQSSAGKAAHAARELDNLGKIFLDPDDLAVVEGVSRSVFDHPGFRKILECGTRREVSLFWVDEETGIECRCRPDACSIDYAFMLDLKSTLNASPPEFARTILDLEYHVQDAFYRDGVRAIFGVDSAMIFGALEKEEPFACSLMTLDEESVDIGRQIYRRRLNQLAECKSSGKWPAYDDGVSIVSLPEWAKRRYANE